MILTSAGAAQTVTGSCHHLEVDGLSLLIDCGLFQGGKETEALNWEPFPFEPAGLDAVLLTHGHLDHVGRLPLLVKAGFRGPIYATAATEKITEIILRDAAKIQGEDFKRALRKAERSGKRAEVQEPLYTHEDVAGVMKLFRRVAFDNALDLGRGVTATYRPAGHILGSAFIEIEDSEARVIFSGDLGNRESSLQADFTLPSACDAVIVETTYANRIHRSQAATLAEFRDLLNRASKTGGKILIPSFALERTQVVLYRIKEMQEAGDIPRMPVFLDSPMAAKFTRLYSDCANEFLPGIQRELERGGDPFEPETMSYSVTTEQSKAINDLEGAAIIVAGSGMMTGGRILHHLKHNLWKDDTSLVVVGYQAHGTLGRRLVDGVDNVRIYGDTIPVRADVHTIGGFSAHADRDDLLAWLESTERAAVYMVHGEVNVMSDFQETLRERDRESVTVERNKPYSL